MLYRAFHLNHSSRNTPASHHHSKSLSLISIYSPATFFYGSIWIGCARLRTGTGNHAVSSERRPVHPQLMGFRQRATRPTCAIIAERVFLIQRSEENLTEAISKVFQVYPFKIRGIYRCIRWPCMELVSVPQKILKTEIIVIISDSINKYLLTHQ